MMFLGSAGHKIRYRQASNSKAMIISMIQEGFFVRLFLSILGKKIGACGLRNEKKFVPLQPDIQMAPGLPALQGSVAQLDRATAF